jgi:hypothetical protein
LPALVACKVKSGALLPVESAAKAGAVTHIATIAAASEKRIIAVILSTIPSSARE